MMRTIIITRPEFFEGETELVNELFRLGMERLHLRKPQATEKEMTEWLDQIDRPFRHLIVLHDYHELAHTYGLGGIHLNRRNPEIPAWVANEKAQRDFTLSRSCHSIEEVSNSFQPSASQPILFDYVTLSPIFDSISKVGYGAAFSHQELRQARQEGLFDHPVYALGGISLDRLTDVHDMGFYGAAILGDLWRSNPLYQLQKILMQTRILG